MADRGWAGLLTAAAAGDELAFERIIVEHHDDMRRVAKYITRDPALADEATQAAWLIAWKKIGKVHDEAHLRPWLVSIAAYEAKRVLRCQTRRAVWRCLRGASRSASSHCRMSGSQGPITGATRVGLARGGGSGDASAWRTVRRWTWWRRASARTDSPSSR
jgi:DNA-directed RNA polymerase specialized sigma24 family protein